MQKSVNYLVVATMVVMAALVSCNKDDKRSNDNECIYLQCNENGEYIGSNEPISAEMLNALNFAMCPNPTHDMTSLIFKTQGLNTVTITDKKGKVLLEQSFDVQTIAINVRSYSDGEYRVTVDNGKQKSTLCLVKNE